jgi:hypothetical protein
VFGEDAPNGPWSKFAKPPEGETVLEGAKGDKLLPPTNGRYQILMSTILAKDTFLLDTVTGKVWQLVQDKRGVLLWQEMLKE